MTEPAVRAPSLGPLAVPAAAAVPLAVATLPLRFGIDHAFINFRFAGNPRADHAPRGLALRGAGWRGARRARGARGGSPLRDRLRRAGRGARGLSPRLLRRAAAEHFLRQGRPPGPARSVVPLAVRAGRRVD